MSAAGPMTAVAVAAVTADLQLEITPKIRLLADYEKRWLLAPDASEDARTIAATMGDRVSIQAGAVF